MTVHAVESTPGDSQSEQTRPATEQEDKPDDEGEGPEDGKEAKSTEDASEESKEAETNPQVQNEQDQQS